jgi:hypothetical protein
VNCLICSQECQEAFLNLGAYCCEGHRLEILRRHQELLAELRREAPGRMPELFSVADFERFTLKLAVHLLDGISPAVRELFRRQMPLLLNPVEMALELKEHILLQLPSTVVALELASGPARLFRSGTYSFLQPVPKDLVLQAIRSARLLPLLGVIPPAGGAGPGTKDGP